MNYDVDIFRGEELESTHRVLLTNIDSKEGFNLYLRSSFKPFQLIPFVSSGGVEEFSLDESTLALFTSSHSGEKIHTDYLEEILINNNINENLLFCSPHWPLSNDRSRQLASLGQRPTRVHNNCSGKHVAMLLMCKLFGFSMNNYTSMTDDLQIFLFDYLSNIFDYKLEKIAIDGCGLPIPYLDSKSVVDTAHKLGKGEGGESNTWMRILNSMKENPYLVGGTGRFDSVVMDQCNKQLVAKEGAEGVIFLQSDNDTTIIKSMDGSRRGVDLLAAHILRKQGLVGGFEFQEEKEILYNRQGQLVGRIKVSK